MHGCKGSKIDRWSSTLFPFIWLSLHPILSFTSIGKRILEALLDFHFLSLTTFSNMQNQVRNSRQKSCNQDEGRREIEVLFSRKKRRSDQEPKEKYYDSVQYLRRKSEKDISLKWRWNYFERVFLETLSP